MFEQMAAKLHCRQIICTLTIIQAQKSGRVGQEIRNPRQIQSYFVTHDVNFMKLGMFQLKKYRLGSKKTI